MTDHTPAGLSVNSQRAFAFLAHHANGDGTGMTAVLRDLEPNLPPDVEVFIFALAFMATRQGVARVGLDEYVGALRALAAARAGDDV